MLYESPFEFSLIVSLGFVWTKKLTTGVVDSNLHQVHNRASQILWLSRATLMETNNMHGWYTFVISTNHFIARFKLNKLHNANHIWYYICESQPSCCWEPRESPKNHQFLVERYYNLGYKNFGKLRLWWESEGLHISLKTKNHVHSQHTLKTLYIQVFLVDSSNTHMFSMTQGTICIHKRIYIHICHKHKYANILLNNNEFLSYV